MTANELRLGNLILKHFEQGEGQLEEVTSRTIFDCQTNPTGKFSYSGIPLSPKVLEAAGFYQLPHFTIQNIWKKDLGRDRVLTVGDVGNPNEMVFITEEEPPVVKSVIAAKNYDYDGKTHLHQLQNLYFALTGSELEIDQNKLP